MTQLFNHDVVKITAEAVGIASLKDEVALKIAQDVEYRVRDIIQESVKFMNHSKRTRLSTTDISNALRVRNIEPLYGFSGVENVEFRRASTAHDLFYVEDEELDFQTVLERPLPVIPLDVTFTAHWLAVEGVQPHIPENPEPSHTMVGSGASHTTTNQSTTPSSALPETASPGLQFPNSEDPFNGSSIQVRSLFKRTLSQEHQLLYQKLTTAVMSDRPRLKEAALNTLRTETGFQQLVPYFVRFAQQRVSKLLKDINVASGTVEMLDAIIANKHLVVEPYLHQVIPTTLSCVLGKRICASPLEEDHWDVRERAAGLVARICHTYSKTYPTLQPRVTKTLVMSLLDPQRSSATKYGAVVGLVALGTEVVRQLLMPNVKSAAVTMEKENSSSLLADSRYREKLADTVWGQLKGATADSGNWHEVFGESVAELLHRKADMDVTLDD